MEPEDAELRAKVKNALGDPLVLSLLSLQLERHGNDLLLSLYGDIELLIDLFDQNGRLFTEQDIRSLYRKYFRGEYTIENEPGSFVVLLLFFFFFFSSLFLRVRHPTSSQGCSFQGDQGSA